MAKTSRKVGSIASKLMKNHLSRVKEKSAAGSLLRQRRGK